MSARWTTVLELPWGPHGALGPVSAVLIKCAPLHFGAAGRTGRGPPGADVLDL